MDRWEEQLSAAGNLHNPEIVVPKQELGAAQAQAAALTHHQLQHHHHLQHQQQHQQQQQQQQQQQAQQHQPPHLNQLPHIPPIQTSLQQQHHHQQQQARHHQQQQPLHNHHSHQQQPQPPAMGSSTGSVNASTANPAGAAATAAAGAVPNTSTDFVRKLFAMLDDPADMDVVRWSDTGDSFVVIDPSEFTKSILPRHFKHSNFASFVRQLNKYDFHKVRVGANETSQYGDGSWEFKHPDFQMNNRDQIENIRRKAPSTRKPGKQQQQQQHQQQQHHPQAANVRSSDDSSHTAKLQAQVDGLQQAVSDLYQRLESSQSEYAQSINSIMQQIQNRDQTMREVINMMRTGDYSRVSQVANGLEAAIANTTAKHQSTGSGGSSSYMGGLRDVKKPPEPPLLQAHHPPPLLDSGHRFLVLLVVEDDNVIRLCRKFLNEYGCDVDIATNGLDAVARTQSSPYDLILMGAVIPQLDGLSATTIMRGQFKLTCPIIIMAEADIPSDRERYHHRGVTDILSKPFSKNDLFKILDNNLGRPPPHTTTGLPPQLTQPQTLGTVGNPSTMGGQQQQPLPQSHTHALPLPLPQLTTQHQQQQQQQQPLPSPQDPGSKRPRIM